MSDPLFPLLIILRYMHILGAITLMGGTIFMRLALLPIVQEMEPAAKADFHQRVRSRWAKFVGMAAGLLLVSGVINLAMAGRYQFEPVLGIAKGYHMIVGIKFLLALPIFFIASMLMGRSQAAQRFQGQARFWMNVNLALALSMVLIGGALRFVPRQLKSQGTAATALSSMDPGVK